MVNPISEEQMAVYRQAAKQRAQERLRSRQSRHQRGWEIAQQAAQILKQQYGADKVAVFGSMLSSDRVHEQSDLDLAVWGLDKRLYYEAISRLLDLDPSISIDLVEVETVRPKIQAVIEREGVLL